jgi:hypothetical protein
MKFFWDVRNYGTSVCQGKSHTKDFKNTMREEFNEFGLSEDVREFIGHAIALNLDDSYLNEHPKITYDKICLYVRSVLSFNDSVGGGITAARQGVGNKGFICFSFLHPKLRISDLYSFKGGSETIRFTADLIPLMKHDSVRMTRGNRSVTCQPVATHRD